MKQTNKRKFKQTKVAKKYSRFYDGITLTDSWKTPGTGKGISAKTWDD